MKREFQIAFLKSVGLRPDHHLLDIGCGTLRGGLPIIEFLEPGHYFGFEVREEVLQEGRAELEEAGLVHKRPLLVGGASIADLELPARPDVMWAFAVLIHMSDDKLRETLRFVSRNLAPGGVFYANVNQDEWGSDGQWQGFPVVARSRDFYQAAAQEAGLVVEDIGSLHDLGHVSGKKGDLSRMLRFHSA